MIKSSTAAVALLVVCLILPSSHLDGAPLPDRMRTSQHELILNGWGARSKSLLKLYISGLYLTQRSHEPANIIAADHPMAIRIEITSIFVSQEKLIAALSEGFHNSTNGNLEPIENEIRQFRECFREEISKGDVFDIVYVPAVGVIVAKNGTRQGIIPGLAFKQALFGIWLCDKPADESLKNAMLGKR